MAAGDHDNTPLMVGLLAAFIVAGLTMWFALTALFAWSVSLILVLAAAVGARRNGSLGPFRYWLVAALAVWIVAFALMHVASSDTARLILGLPPATAAAVYILWPAPLLLVTLPYAWHFHDHVLTDEDWAAIEQFRRDADRRAGS